MSGTIIVVIVVAVLAVGFLVYKMVTGRVELTKAEVEKTLQSFLDGTDGKWDWDDFVSVPIKDPVLDSIRERLSASDTGGEYPPATEAGRKIIQQLLEELSRYAA
jgi:hypothetical protein